MTRELLADDERLERDGLRLLVDVRDVDAAGEREEALETGLISIWRVPVAGDDLPGSKRLLPTFVAPLFLIIMPRLPEYPAGAVDT